VPVEEAARELSVPVPVSVKRRRGKLSVVGCQLSVKRLATNWDAFSFRSAFFPHPARCDEGGVKYHRRPACVRALRKLSVVSCQCQ
jgi:hypothetical protein